MIFVNIAVDAPTEKNGLRISYRLKWLSYAKN